MAELDPLLIDVPHRRFGRTFLLGGTALLLGVSTLVPSSSETPLRIEGPVSGSTDQGLMPAVRLGIIEGGTTSTTVPNPCPEGSHLIGYVQGIPICSSDTPPPTSSPYTAP